MNRPPADEVLMWMKENLEYNPINGEFYVIKKYNDVVQIDDMIGSWSSDGYIVCSLPWGRFRAHILAWLWNYKEWPGGPLDHIDGGRGNNRIENLRVVSPRENSLNRVDTKEHAYISPYNERYSVSIAEDGVQVLHVGVATLEEAIAMRDFWLENFGWLQPRNNA